MAGSHDKIIADAAKVELSPLGLRRKGRSRTWLADHGWWLTVVEFQPSSWSKGSYLNVAAHWLWSESGNLSFDFGDRVAEFEEYVSDEQFAASALKLAARAAIEVQRLVRTFPSVEATADVLLAEECKLREQGQAGWMSYYAGVATGLLGRQDEAAEVFTRVANSPAPPGSVLHPAAERMSRLVRDPLGFRHEVESLVRRQRDALRLPALDAAPF